MRKEFCEKDGILITYTNDNVCFEDTKTAESILLSNDGKILHSNFDDKKKSVLYRIFEANLSCDYNLQNVGFCGDCVNADNISSSSTVLLTILTK